MAAATSGSSKILLPGTKTQTVCGVVLKKLCNNACIRIHILMDSNNNILNNMPVINSMLCMSPLM
jgi:hypothetical protein